MSAPLAKRLHRAARWYGKHGLPVHPLRPGSKLPLLMEWQRNATTDLAIIDRWWSAHRGANIGIATSNTVVVDSDPRHLGDDSLAELEAQHGSLPDTWRDQTAHGGQHIWFEPGSVVVRNSASKLGPGLDVRAQGGFVVAPPSILESGREYVWFAGYGPHELPLAPVPKWLVTLLQETGGHHGARSQRIAASEWSDLLMAGIPPGRIQTTSFGSRRTCAARASHRQCFRHACTHSAW